MEKNEIAYSVTRNLRRACFWSFNLNQYNAQQYILNVSSKGRLSCFFHLEKIKNRNAYPCKSKKKIKRAAVSFSKMCRSKIFVTQQKLLRILKIHYKIFDNSLQKFGLREMAQSKKQHFRRPVNHKSTFFTSCLNMLLSNQILHILCISIKPNVSYSWQVDQKTSFRIQH